MHSQSALSTEYVRAAVGATASGVTVDITVDVVKMAFPLTGVAPVSGDWKTSDWETDSSTGTYYARCLVGPGPGAQIALTAGVLYDVYVWITDNPELPIRNTGSLAIL